MSDTVLTLCRVKAVEAFSGRGYTPTDTVAPDLLVGLELEIERFPGNVEWQLDGFQFTSDGSLRNNGIEAISNPVATKFVRHMLENFYRRFDIRQDQNYTDRCSTHVHINVQDMTPEQICTLSLVYQTAERLLFKFVGNDRMNNIYCVPWYQSGMSYSAVNKILADGKGTWKQWQKYSALNLTPITSYGTVEFRHLHGTCDIDLICRWIDILSCIILYAKRTTLEQAKDQIVNMNTVSNYHEWLNSVFGRMADFLRNEDSEADLSKGVIDSKMMLIEPEKRAYFKKDPFVEGLIRRGIGRTDEAVVVVPEDATPEDVQRLVDHPLDFDEELDAWQRRLSAMAIEGGEQPQQTIQVQRPAAQNWNAGEWFNTQNQWVTQGTNANGTATAAQILANAAVAVERQRQQQIRPAPATPNRPRTPNPLARRGNR